ncbi:MAG: phosphopentomutase [Cellulosilyticaceae bacterium]
MKRAIWIVLDSVGIGGMKDSEQYGDKDVNTLAHVYQKNGKLHIPNMIELGIANIEGIDFIKSIDRPIGTYARMQELSKGKDTTTGHWEMVGIYTDVPFPTYPQGFPDEVMDKFHEQIGVKSIGNCPASGTQILEDLGEEHMQTGYPIVYTSADSVFQIAAHEEVIPLEKLYEMCEIARNILVDKHEVSRVIARPFVGTPGNFTRTPNRRDFAVTPPENNLLVNAKCEGLDVIGIGKIEDIFAGQGITEAIHTKSNEDGILTTIKAIKDESKGIIFTNLVDFDMKWGHRNDYIGYGKGLEEFDCYLPRILEEMNDEDILFITADHGCDPTTPGTDHTRECVPLLVYGKQIKQGKDLGIRKSFADIGQTISEMFNLPSLPVGESFYKELV